MVSDYLLSQCKKWKGKGPLVGFMRGFLLIDHDDDQKYIFWEFWAKC